MGCQLCRMVPFGKLLGDCTSARNYVVVRREKERKEGKYDICFVRGGPAPFEKRLGKFDHQGVTKIDFSPHEKYLVTASMSKPEDNKEDDSKTVRFHEVSTGKLKLEFVGVKSSYWPLFRWSHDDEYFATVTKDKIQVYQSSTMQLLGGKSLKVPGVKMFSWSPSANILGEYFSFFLSASLS